jgi:hypothetical protein
MPTFCRHGRFLQNCRICNPVEAKPAPAARPKSSGSASGTTPRRSGTRTSSAVVVKRQARSAEDGYEHELVPGLKASGDAKRLAAELAFATARLGELAADPPGLYAEVTLAENSEEAYWLAFQIAHLSPLAADPAPFASIERARTTWDSGDPPRLGEGVVLGPRTTVDPKQPTRTADAYRAWVARQTSQADAFAGEATWTPQRRFGRLYERLSIPGFARAGRFELLTSIGRLGLAEIEPGELRYGEAADATTIAAKRVFGIGDTYLLEQRTAALAEAAGVPLAAFDLALFNFGQAEPARATMGATAEADADLAGAIEDALGV